VLISLSQAIEPVGGYTAVSLMHGQCDARRTVTFAATEHHRPLASTNLYCLVNRSTLCVNNLPKVVREAEWTRTCDLLVVSPAIYQMVIYM